MSQWTIGLSPLLPPAAIAALAVVALAVMALGLFRQAPGLVWRLLAAAGLVLALANPTVVVEEREPLKDIAVVVLDESPSQNIGERRARGEAALQAIETRLARRDDIELRVQRPRPGESSGPARGAVDGTYLFSALEQALANVPRQRLAGAILITDGQVHDAPDEAEALGFEQPLHALITGERGKGDRRLTVVQAPSYGIVGHSVTLTLRVDDPPHVARGRVKVTIRRGAGEVVGSVTMTAGAPQTMEVVLDRAGASVFEIEVEAGPQELTLDNNHSVIVVNGVRDRLRVLLVSGEPHPGERTWRNLLKADPAVDLVHFTILRPPEKQDGTPVRELSLIAFPIRELFELKVNEFDLIIFDRYRRRGVLPQIYLANIADYVLNGGAFLEAVGPSFASPLSLYRTPLGQILPGEPTGEIIEEGYRAAVTEIGRRHPVTAGLDGAGAPGEEPEWGRWFRQITVAPKSGTVVMKGARERPLMILDRVGEGRVAQLTSDHMWLWARGFEGGGPQAQLLRRLAHWLMKEPELEEDNLTAEARGGRLEIVRRSLEPDDNSVEVTFPSGRVENVQLQDEGDGRATGALAVAEAGLYRLSDSTRTALAAVGALNPLEFADVAATDLNLGHLARANGGGVVWLAEVGEPEVRLVRPGRDAFGAGRGGARPWIGLRANGDYVVTGVTELPLWPGLATLVLALSTLLLAWRREGR